MGLWHKEVSELIIDYIVLNYYAPK